MSLSSSFFPLSLSLSFWFFSIEGLNERVDSQWFCSQVSVSNLTHKICSLLIDKPGLVCLVIFAHSMNISKVGKLHTVLLKLYIQVLRIWLRKKGISRAKEWVILYKLSACIRISLAIGFHIKGFTSCLHGYNVRSKISDHWNPQLVSNIDITFLSEN